MLRVTLDQLSPEMREQAKRQLAGEKPSAGMLAQRSPTALDQLAGMHASATLPPRKSKYSAQRAYVNEIGFDSKAEAKRYVELLALQACGEVIRIHRQVMFDLPGKTVYKVDFQVFWADGRVTYEDVKGVRTENFQLKRRQVRSIYGVEIQVLGRKRGSKRK